MAKTGGRGGRRGRITVISTGLAAGVANKPAHISEQDAQVSYIKDQKFATAYAADSWGKKSFDPWVDSLSPSETGGISNYTGAQYGTINRLLRDGKYSPESYPGSITTTSVKGIDAALAKKGATVPKDITVRRGMSYSVIKDLGDGAEFEDLGFISTSLSPKHTWGVKHMVEILVPKGTKGGYVQRISSHKSEYEFLLNRGTRFKVIRKGQGSSYDPTILAVVGQS